MAAAKRKFALSDADMIQDSRVRRALFLLDKGDFINFDASFADPYANDFNNAIDAAESMDDNETLVARQTQLTKNVLDEMNACRKKFQESKVFISKAFPDNYAMQFAFGFYDYTKAQKVQLTFTNFMLRFYKMASKHNAKLIAVNYSQIQIDEILTRHDALDNATTTRDLFIKSRPVLSRQRILNLNNAWKFNTTICEAARSIYKNNYAKLKQYSVSSN
jgi:hypothetical protein